MTNLQTAVEAKIERAMDEVSRLCKPGEQFRMSIPANREHDSDLIISEALRAAREEIAALRQVDYLQPVRDQLEVQGRDGNCNHNSYMLGMYNGLECALATLENREAEYRNNTDLRQMGATNILPRIEADFKGFNQPQVAPQTASPQIPDAGELLGEWCVDQGFEQWTLDHIAVLSNLEKWLTARLKGATHE